MPVKLEELNIGLIIILLCVFIFLLYQNTVEDDECVKTLGGIPSHVELDVPKIRDVDRLVIESVVSEYWRKKTMNTSNCHRIWDEVKTGAVRGALGGAVMGGGASSVAAGAIVFGTLSGILKAYNLKYSKEQYLIPYKTP